MPFFHFTCGHGFDALGRGRARVEPLAVWNPRAARKIAPRYAVLARVTWFTDLDTPWPREALGLTGRTIRCDRTAHRYRVLDESKLEPWLGSAHRAGPVAEQLETEPGALPRHWFVASVAVAVVYDPLAPGD